MSVLTQRIKIAAKAAVGIFSDSSLRQAAGLLPGVLPGAAGVAPTRGTADFLRAYSQMPWLRAVTSRIATATARAEWQLYVTQGLGDKKATQNKAIQRASSHHRRYLLKQAAAKNELRQITDHPMLDVLTQANEFETGFQMRKITQLHIDLVGDCFWLKERDAQGMVVGVWPIPAHWILATPTPNFRFFRVSFKAWRGNIPDTEFVWFSDPDPLNPYGRGSGAAMALGDELDTDEYAARHTKAFFYNQARPDIIVWPKNGGMNESNIKRVEEDWLEKTQGFWRAFKPYFMTREVEVKELKQDFRGQQFVQLREFERNMVLQQFGVPPEVLGVIENSNRSTIDAADYMMSRYVIEPRLEFQRQILQERLAPEYDERLIVEYVSPVREDKEYALDVAKVAGWALSTDEWRALMGHPPSEDAKAGKLHAVPTTVHMQPIEEYKEPPPPPIVRPAGPARPAPKPARRAMSLQGIPEGSWKDAVRDDIEVASNAGDAALAEALTKGIEDVDGIPESSVLAERMEPQVQRLLVRCWGDHAARLNRVALEAAFQPGGVIGDAIAALELPALNTAQAEALVGPLTTAFIKGVDLGNGPLRRAGIQARRAGVSVLKPDIAIDLAGSHAAAAAWAAEHAAALAVVPTAVRAIIVELVERSIKEGIEPRDLARMLTDTIGLRADQVAAVANFRARLVTQGLGAEVVEVRTARYALAQRRARAMLIARTELIGALNQGQMTLWRDAVSQGVLQEAQFDKVWITTPDDRLCPVCEGMDEEQVALEDSFSAGVDAPPEHPLCRCAIGLVPRTVMRQAAAAPLPPTIHVEVHAPAPVAIPAPVVTIQQAAQPAPSARRRTFTYDADDRVASTTDEMIPQKESE